MCFTFSIYLCQSRLPSLLCKGPFLWVSLGICGVLKKFREPWSEERTSARSICGPSCPQQCHRLRITQCCNILSLANNMILLKFFPLWGPFSRQWFGWVIHFLAQVILLHSSFRAISFNIVVFLPGFLVFVYFGSVYPPEYEQPLSPQRFLHLTLFLVLHAVRGGEHDSSFPAQKEIDTFFSLKKEFV